MPLPWKKNRVTRITQIVADLQSPKRGGSLVVETGFPTSLIDLIVKNRSRFKKSKSKKPFNREIPDLPPPPPSPATPLPLSATPIRSDLAFDYTEPSHAEALSSCRLAVETVLDGGGVSGRVGECTGGSSVNMVVAVILKMFVVVISILSVKKLTVGVTMSAIMLLFLEYAGKRVVSFLTPCSNANKVFESLTQRVSSCVLFQNLQLKMKKNCECPEPIIVQGDAAVSEFVGGAELISKSLSLEEIEVLEAKSEINIWCEGTNFAGTELGSFHEDKKWGCPVMQQESKGKVVEQIEVSECKTKGKFKSNMVKKLVPKKFRGSKKEKKETKNKEREADSGSEASTTTVEEDKSPSLEIEEYVEREESNNSNGSALLVKTKLQCIRDDEADYGVTCSQESPLTRDVIGMSNDGKRIDSVRNSSSYVILLIVALAGLVFGHFPALMLTVTWCFMLKMVKIRWRSQNVPLIKCSIPNS